MKTPRERINPQSPRESPKFTFLNVAGTNPFRKDDSSIELAQDIEEDDDGFEDLAMEDSPLGKAFWNHQPPEGSIFGGRFGKTAPSSSVNPKMGSPMPYK